MVKTAHGKAGGRKTKHVVANMLLCLKAYSLTITSLIQCTLRKFRQASKAKRRLICTPVYARRTERSRPDAQQLISKPERQSCLSAFTTIAQMCATSTAQLFHFKMGCPLIKYNQFTLITRSNMVLIDE